MIFLYNNIQKNRTYFACAVFASDLFLVCHMLDVVLKLFINIHNRFG